MTGNENDRRATRGEATPPPLHATVGDGCRGRRATSRRRQARSERAISDLVGYALTIGIILVGVGIVSTVGVEQIARVQSSQNVQNAERAATVFAGNLNELQESRAVVRTSELAAYSGRVGIGTGSGPSEIEVNVTGTDFHESYPLRTVTFQVEDTVVAYEGGAVLLHDPRGSPVPVREPAFTCDEDRALVSFVTLDGPGLGRSYSGGTGEVTAWLNNSRNRFPMERSGSNSLNDSNGVNVAVDSEYQEAWGTFFDGDWTQVDPTTYRCAPSGGGMPVFVRQSIVDVVVRR